MKARTFRKKSDRIKDFAARKAEIYSMLGRKTEERIVKLLEKKLEESALHSFEYNKPLSKNDLAGEDFTVRKKNGNDVSVRHFGVTISGRSLRNHNTLHPGVPCILITFEMRDERIWERIEELFKN